MSKSNLAKKIGKLMVVGFPGKSMTPEVKELIHTYHVGGIILFSRNIGAPEEVYELTKNLQEEAKNAGYERPLFICLDQENGVVRRLGKGTTLFPGAMALGATGNPDLAHDICYATGEELKALGINWNLAPVLDVNNNPDNPVIGVRSFGESPDQVVEFGRAAMKGMQEAGVITTLKHFPGHGDTNVDSHLDLPTIAHGLDRLEQVELKPFKACIDTGADVVMTAHIHFPAIEPEKNKPATLSKNVLTHLLREKLGFTGVVTTDCMEMDAIADTIGTKQGAVAAFKAGSDFIMVSHTRERQIGAIKAMIAAVEQGDISEESINQSVQRISQLLDKYVNWESVLGKDKDTELKKVGSSEHQELAKKVYEQSVTVVRNHDVLPIQSDEKTTILIIEQAEQLQTRAEDARQNKGIGEAVKEHAPSLDIETIDQNISPSKLEHLITKASHYDYVIFGTSGMTPENPLHELLTSLQEKEVKVIGIGMRNPYEVNQFPEADAFLNTYEPSYRALQTATRAMFGKVKVSGKLPVTI